jgi:hypothetical protein
LLEGIVSKRRNSSIARTQVKEIRLVRRCRRPRRIGTGDRNEEPAYPPRSLVRDTSAGFGPG